MANRIEHSRRHGHYDPRWTTRLHQASVSALPIDVPEEPTETPAPTPTPTLTLVGGTEHTPHGPLAPPGT
jgi:hypothetical protein